MEYKKIFRVFMKMTGISLLFIFLIWINNVKEVTADQENENEWTKTKEEQAQEYIEGKYGIADNPVYGKHVTHTKIMEGIISKNYEESFKENSKGGIVFLKNLTSEGKTEGIVYVYLTDSENGKKITLNVTYTGGDPFREIRNYAYVWDKSMIKDCCYIIVGKEYLASIEIKDKDLIHDPGYSESIVVYKLDSSDSEKVCEITRTFAPWKNPLKDYRIEKDGNYIVYEEGYTNYTMDNARFLSTEQEFYNEVNSIFEDISMDDCITLNPIIWDLRWDLAVDITENGTRNDVTKVDFSYSEPTIEENGDEITDITIWVNKDKMQEVGIEDEKQ